MSAGFTFALPPSLGRDSNRLLARELAAALFDVGFATIQPTRTYAELESSLLSGEADAAWSPPIVGARVERAGGAVAFRGVRGGETSYRSVLVARRRDGLTLDVLRNGDLPPLRAAWVDAWSMAGYVLPRHLLRSSGIDLEAAFAVQLTCESYDECIRAVLGYDADLTASFSGPHGHGFRELAGDRADELSVIAVSSPCDNDGLVVRPGLAPNARAALIAALRRAIEHPGIMAVLATTLDVDGFDEPAAGTYEKLLELL